MKTLLLSIICIALFAGCSSDTAKIDHAKFEIEQGNFVSARRYLESVPQSSPQFNTADSLLKAIKDR
ncbi:MAG: hypothetical protein JNL74_20430 [Fibrobacteres bacterium]|nr:hypothetical protein [Fibrobacterota bacterium]